MESFIDEMTEKETEVVVGGSNPNLLLDWSTGFKLEEGTKLYDKNNLSFSDQVQIDYYQSHIGFE